MAARPGDPGRWMAETIRCLLVRLERLERPLADASGSSKGRQAPQTPLGRISRCAVVDTFVEWLEPVRLEPQEIEIVLTIKEETVEELMLVPRKRVKQWTADQIGNVPQFRDETVDAVTPVPRERMQQRTAEQMVEWPQSPGETVDAVTLVQREQVQERTAEKLWCSLLDS